MRSRPGDWQLTTRSRHPVPESQRQQSNGQRTFAAAPAAAAPGCHRLCGVAPRCRSPAHYLWAMLLARLFESLPLVCPHCGADMRIVAFITEAAPVEYAT